MGPRLAIFATFAVALAAECVLLFNAIVIANELVERDPFTGIPSHYPLYARVLSSPGWQKGAPIAGAIALVWMASKRPTLAARVAAAAALLALAVAMLAFG